MEVNNLCVNPVISVKRAVNSTNVEALTGKDKVILDMNYGQNVNIAIIIQQNWTLKNGVFWVVMPCGSYKNRFLSP
jgi:hypothetical protein